MCVDQGLTLAIMALHLTMPCTRMLFMSEEWAATSPFPYFVGYDDRVLLDAIRAGRAAKLTDKEAYSWGVCEYESEDGCDGFREGF